MSARRADAGLGCLVAFLLPFAGFGVFAAVEALRQARAGEPGQAAMLMLFALVFGGVGVGGIAAALLGRRKVVEREALVARHPEAPWLWRSDWAAGRIEDSGRTTMWAALAFAAFWNLISLPSAWLAVRAALTEGKTAALVALIFPVVGVGLLVWAVRATLRYRRYGVSVLELRSVPWAVGRTAAGTVRTTSLLQPADGFEVRLRSVRRVTRGAGKNRSTSERVLWEEARRAPGKPSRTARGMSTEIPFAIPIPRDAEPSDGRDPRDAVLWWLRVAASVPGVDYEASFEVPVFRSVASDLPAEETETVVEPLVPADYRQPPESRIQVTTNRRGTEIHFPAARNPGAAAGVTLFLLVWLAAIAGMVAAEAPTFLIVVFGIFAVLLVWGALELWLRVTRVTADAGTIAVASGFLSPARERRFAMAEIAEVKAKIGMEAGGRPYYDLVLVGRDGRTTTAAHGIRDKQEAEWLAEMLRRALGPR